MTLERLAKGSEASATLVRFDSGAGYHAEVELMVKRDPEASSDISQFYGQLMSSAFYVTSTVVLSEAYSHHPVTEEVD